MIRIKLEGDSELLDALSPCDFCGVLDPCVPSAAHKGDRNTGGIEEGDMEIEERYRKENGQDLLDVGCKRTSEQHARASRRSGGEENNRGEDHAPATVMLSAPTLPFAEKLTMLRPNARHPLRRRVNA